MSFEFFQFQNQSLAFLTVTNDQEQLISDLRSFSQTRSPVHCIADLCAGMPKSFVSANSLL